MKFQRFSDENFYNFLTKMKKYAVSKKSGFHYDYCRSFLGLVLCFDALRSF